jgi:hypothetical protein
VRVNMMDKNKAAGKLWDSLSELRSSLCETRLDRTVPRPALLPVRTAQFTQFFHRGMTLHSKIAQFNISFRRGCMITGTDHMNIDDAVHTVKEERNIRLTKLRRKAKWIGHVLRDNCLLENITGGKRRKRLLDTFRK